MRSAWAALPLLMIALAGCVADGPDSRAGSVDYDAIEAAIGTFDLAASQDGDGVLGIGSYNLEQVGVFNGRDGPKPATEVYWQTAVQGDYAYLTRQGPESGLVVFDISDIEEPVAVASIRLEAGFEPDIEISSDGRWGFWETQRFPTSAQTPTVTEPGANLPRGVHIIDLADKNAPQWAGFSPTLPDGPHSITYADLDGRHILLQSVYAFAYAYAGVDAPMMQRLVITELDTSGPVAQLDTLAEYRLPEAQGNLGQMPHDVSVQKHPLTGQWLAYISYWDQGLVIIDITDPAAPVFVGKSNDFGPASYGAIHMTRPFDELIGGRHVTVAEPEIGGAPDSGYMTFFDTTDPTAPTYISSWKIPGESDSGGGGWGPHYFDVHDGRVALAHYRAGYWVIDVHDEANLLQPRTVAYAEVNSTANSGISLPLSIGSANAFDAWWTPDGQHIVAGDMQGGLAIYRYLGPQEPAA